MRAFFQRQPSAPRAMALVLLLAAPLGCDSLSPPAEIQVVHRCGDLQMGALSGTFGRVEGGNNINSRYRIRFDQEGAITQARFVAGKHHRSLMDGVRTGNESMVFTQVLPKPRPGERARRIWVSLNDDCRLEVADGWVRFGDGGERDGKDPGDPLIFVPFDLSRLDFEPCTERLYIRQAARSQSAARKARVPETPPVVTESKLPLGTWAPRSELDPGCRPEVDLWIDGEAEAIELPIKEGTGSEIHWTLDYEVRTIGSHGLALHRVARCGEQRKLLGVACADIEVR